MGMLLQQSMQQNAMVMQMFARSGGGGGGGGFNSPQPSASSFGGFSSPPAAPVGTYLVETTHPWKKCDAAHVSDTPQVGTILTAVAHQPWPKYVRVMDSDGVVRSIGAAYVQRGALSRCSDYLTASRPHSFPLLLPSGGATVTAATVDGGAAVAAAATSDVGASPAAAGSRDKAATETRATRITRE
jgi:hypothetical protein